MRSNIALNQTDYYKKVRLKASRLLSMKIDELLSEGYTIYSDSICNSYFHGNYRMVVLTHKVQPLVKISFYYNAITVDVRIEKTGSKTINYQHGIDIP